MLLGAVPLLVLSGRKNAETVCVAVCERRANKRVWHCSEIKQKVAVYLVKQKPLHCQKAFDASKS